MKRTHAYTVGNRFQLPLLIVAIAVVFGFTACAVKNPYIIELMPAPDVYIDESIDPFAEIDLEIEAPYQGILYASDRKPTSKHEKPSSV